MYVWVGVCVCICVGGLDVYMFVREVKWICMYVYMYVGVGVGGCISIVKT